MKPAHMHLGPDRGQSGHLMTPGLGILTAQGVTASPAPRWLAVGDRSDAIGRHQGPHPAGMPVLAAPRFFRGRSGWPPLHPDRVGRRRPGAVGGILVDASLQVLDLLPQLDDLPLQAIDDDPDDSTGLVGKAVPDVLRDRRPPVHAAVIIGRVWPSNPGREQLRRMAVTTRRAAMLSHKGNIGVGRITWFE